MHGRAGTGAQQPPAAGRAAGRVKLNLGVQSPACNLRHPQRHWGAFQRLRWLHCLALNVERRGRGAACTPLRVVAEEREAFEPLEVKPSPGEIFSGLAQGSKSQPAPSSAPLATRAPQRRRADSGGSPNPFRNPNPAARERGGGGGAPRRGPPAGTGQGRWAPGEAASAEPRARAVGAPAYTRIAAPDPAGPRVAPADDEWFNDNPVPRRRDPPASTSGAPPATPGTRRRSDDVDPAQASVPRGGGERAASARRRIQEEEDDEDSEDDDVHSDRRKGDDGDELGNRRYDPDDKFARGARRRPARGADTEETPWRGPTATFFTADSFQDIGASPRIIASLAEMGITRPSFVQAAAYRAFLTPANRHLAIADHAGSGKTLAYLLPLVQAFKEAEEAAGKVMTRPNLPSMMVITPTAELCAQVLSVARSLARGVPFRNFAATGGHKGTTQKRTLAEGVDLLVATPGRLLQLLDAGDVRLDACQALVLDEVDVLLGDAAAFRDQMMPLLARTPPATRVVLVTATMPEAVWWDVTTQFPGIMPVLGPGLHRTAPGVVEQLVDCSGGEEINEETGQVRKGEALLRVLREQPVPRTIVFCNKIETCRKVENLLNRSAGRDIPDVQIVAYHSAVAPETRDKNFKDFMKPPKAGRAMVLVCTDRASRGIDSAHVQHVVLFDFPRDPSEYVRRAGRTARGAGGRGVVSVLVLGRQVRLAKDVMERNEKGLPIHKVPSV